VKPSSSGADSDARFERLLEELGPALRRLAASYEPVASRRDDLFQEIALALWQGLRRFRGDCSLRTFAFRIAHNRAVTYAWHRRRTAASDLAEAERVPDPREDAASTMQRTQARGKLYAAIRSLPIVHRQVLTLTLEDLSQAEIGAVLGVSENAVAVRLTRARKALRVALGVST